MNLSFQRKVDHIVGIFICWIFSLFSRENRDLLTKISPQKILIILLSEMGSLVLAHPMFEHIKAKYHKASIYVLVFEQNKEILELMEVVPSNNIITVSNASLTRMVGSSLRALMRLRQINIDTVIDCELFARVSSIYSYLSGAKLRAGFHPHTQEGLFRGNFINRPVLYNPYNHISQQFITLVEALESGTVPAVKREIPVKDLKAPSLKVSTREVNDLKERFERDFPQVSDKKLVLIYPGGGLLPIRAWALGNFCLVANDLIQNGYAVGIIGLHRDRELANDILAYCKHNHCVDLTGYTESIRELMVIFSFASLLITNDGGPGHFASMTPLPSIILYGPETPLLYGPLSKNSFNFYVQLACSPCLTAYNHRNSPCDGDNVCLKSISPQDVLTKAYELLKDKESSLLTNGTVDREEK